MSDVPLRPEWWQASDGRWYPPEAHPSYRSAPVREPSQFRRGFNLGAGIACGMLAIAVVVWLALGVIVEIASQ